MKMRCIDCRGLFEKKIMYRVESENVKMGTQIHMRCYDCEEKARINNNRKERDYGNSHKKIRSNINVS